MIIWKNKRDCLTVTVRNYIPVGYEIIEKLLYLSNLPILTYLIYSVLHQFIKDFYNETMIEIYDWTPDEEHLTILYSLTVSIFAIGGMTGALLVGKLVTRYGRSVADVWMFFFFFLIQSQTQSVLMHVKFHNHKCLYFWLFEASCSLIWVTVCPNRKGTLVRSSILVFVGGSMMGFSRWCKMPAMVIFGRFITGVHSGRTGTCVSSPQRE